MTPLSAYIIHYTFDGPTISIIWHGRWWRDNKTISDNENFYLRQTLVKVMSFILLSTFPKKSVCIVKILKPNKNISNYFEGTKRHFQAKSALVKVPVSHLVIPSLLPIVRQFDNSIPNLIIHNLKRQPDCKTKCWLD